jgi:hypothetical protein
MKLLQKAQPALREFAYSDVLFEREQFIAYAQQTQATHMVRSVVLHPYSLDNGRFTLEEALQRADQHFDLIAKQVGASVVPHEFGLCKLPTAVGSQNGFVPGFPHEFYLVAEVAVIKNAEPVPLEMAAKIRHAVSEVRAATGNIWFDSYPTQYVSGTVDGHYATWQVDIDPTVYSAAFKPGLF